MAFDSDILISQIYSRKNEDASTMRTGTVLEVDEDAGTISVNVGGQRLDAVPYSVSLNPIVGEQVWLIAQGSWFVAISADANTGQGGGGFTRDQRINVRQCLRCLGDQRLKL